MVHQVGMTRPRASGICGLYNCMQRFPSVLWLDT
jgi:hypothetical protein